MMSLLKYSILATSALRDKATTAIALALVLASIPVLYRLYFHPLRHVPGPFLGRISSLYIYTICYLGIESRVLRHYHQRYKTKVLRVAPNSVSICDSAAIRDIYVSGGGFSKDARYSNFNLGDVISIFSATDNDYRDVRAKAVAPLFAPARLRAASEPNGVIGECVAKYIKQLQEFKTAAVTQSIGAVKADILDLCARLSIDIVTGYLLDRRYGGLDEHAHLSIEARQQAKLTANPFIFAIVAFSRFSLLPNWLFRIAYAISCGIGSSNEAATASVRIGKFTDEAIKIANAEPSAAEDMYQGRLLKANILPSEVSAQSQAVIFAGADSTAVMLATILFHLVQNALVRARLSHEIRSQDRKGPVDPQAQPYLRAVVKEGLRLGMANPTRFTRVVPAGGLRVGNFHLPPSTVVGCAPAILHHNADVFPNSFEFRPERWLEDGQDNGLRRSDMERNLIPFGAGLRACIGKNLAQQQLYESVIAVVSSDVLEGARTCQERIEITEWFNGEIKGHKLEIEWSAES